jgi:hypothetical protein
LAPFETNDDFFVDPDRLKDQHIVPITRAFDPVILRNRKTEGGKDIQILQHGPRVDGYELESRFSNGHHEDVEGNNLHS